MNADNLAYARFFVQGGGRTKKFVTGPQQHLAALGLGDSSLFNSPRHAASKPFEINQLAYH